MKKIAKENSVLVFAYKYCRQDPRIQREINALLDEGYAVDFICAYDKKQIDPIIDNVNVHPVLIERKREGIIRYLFEYAFFALTVFIKVNTLYYRKRFTIIMAFVMPEFLLLNCLIPKIFGAKILMDWEDPSLEVFLSKFKKKNAKLFVSLILIFEKISVAIANVIITPNTGFKKAFVKRGHDPKKIKIVMNAPDLKLFLPRKNRESKQSITALYNGSIVERHGLHVLIKAIPDILKSVPDFTLLVYGGWETDYLNLCKSMVKRLELDSVVIFKGGVHISKMPEVIESISLGIVPNVETPFTKINFPQRIIEFGLYRKPMLVSRLPGIEDYYDDESICFFNPGDSKDLSEKLVLLYNDKGMRDRLVENAYEISINLKWKKEFVDIVNTLSES